MAEVSAENDKETTRKPARVRKDHKPAQQKQDTPETESAPETEAPAIPESASKAQPWPDDVPTCKHCSTLMTWDGVAGWVSVDRAPCVIDGGHERSLV